MELRNYQKEAIAAIYDYLRQQSGNPCCVIPTGGGKTPILVSICKDTVEKWNGRVLVLAHVKELLEQAKDKLKLFYPDLPVGVYSAGLGERTSDGPVIIAGIQSVYRRAKELGRFDLIIVDESHMLPEDGDGMYRRFLAEMREINPNLRLIGLTATPYRMTSGMLCGPDNLLNEICYEIGVKELITHGYLCPLITKGTRIKQDYSQLHIRAGEFVASEVDQLVNTESKVSAVCREIIEQAEKRNRVLIFAGSVEHAQNIQATINRLTGQECGLITGNTPSAERDILLRRFKGEEIAANLFNEKMPDLKYIVNVNVLTTGFDAPNIDCIALVRPTASPGLYYQMVGRGLRLHPSKTECLVLDFGGNILRHGPIDAIKSNSKGKGTGEAPVKQCPECQLIIHAAYSICPGCGYTFPARESSKIAPEASQEAIISCDEVNVYDVEEVRYNVHTKAGADPNAPHTMRVDYRIGWNQYRSEWVCVEHEGWPRQKFEKWWKARSTAPIPSSAFEAVLLAQAGALAETKKITVTKPAGEKYDRVTDYELGEIPDRSNFTVSDNVCGDCVYFDKNHCGYENRFNIPPESPACVQFIDKDEIPF